MLLNVLCGIIIRNNCGLTWINLMWIHDDLVNVVGLNLPTDWVLNAHDVGVDLCIDVLAVLEGQVGVQEPTVLQG